MFMKQSWAALRRNGRNDRCEEQRARAARAFCVRLADDNPLYRRHAGPQPWQRMEGNGVGSVMAAVHLLDEVGDDSTGTPASVTSRLRGAIRIGCGKVPVVK